MDQKVKIYKVYKKNEIKHKYLIQIFWTRNNSNIVVIIITFIYCEDTVWFKEANKFYKEEQKKTSLNQKKL